MVLPFAVKDLQRQSGLKFIPIQILLFGLILSYFHKTYLKFERFIEDRVERFPMNFCFMFSFSFWQEVNFDIWIGKPPYVMIYLWFHELLSFKDPLLYYSAIQLSLIFSHLRPSLHSLGVAINTDLNRIMRPIRQLRRGHG